MSKANRDSEARRGEGQASSERADSSDRRDSLPPIEENRYWFRLRDDPYLRQAMRSGNYERFRHILGHYRRQATDREEIAAIDYAFSNPQYFVEPVGKEPANFDVFGFGIRLVGKKDFDHQTGFRIATLYLTLLFIPVFPLRRYLVRSDDEQAFEYHGKLSSSVGQNLWRIAFVFGMLAMGCLSAAVYAVASYTHEVDVQMINAFDEPVKVAVEDDDTYMIPPRQMVTEQLPEGHHQFSTHFDDDRPVETFEFYVPRRQDLVVYNVAGAAPATYETVTYFDMEGQEYQSGSYLEHVEDIDYAAGKRRFVRDHIDYIDVDPPDEIDTFGEPRRVQWGFFYEAHDSDTWADYEWHEAPLSPSMALDQLANHHPDRRDELLETLLELEPNEPSYLMRVDSAIYNAVYVDEDPDRAHRWFDDLVALGDQYPDSSDIHDTLLELKTQYGDVLGRTPADEYYRQHHERHDSTMTALWLALVTDDPQEGKSLVKRVIDETESSMEKLMANRRGGDLHYRTGDCRQAVEYYQGWFELAEKLRDDEEYYFFGEELEPYVSCLVEQQRFDDAKSMVRNVVEKRHFQDAYVDQLTSQLHGRVVLSKPDSDADPFSLIRWHHENYDHTPFTDDQKVVQANAIGYALDSEQLDGMNLAFHSEGDVELNRTLHTEPGQLLETVRRQFGTGTAVHTPFQFLASLLQLAEDERVAWLDEVYHEFSHFTPNLHELPQATNDYRFDGEPPETWWPWERSAYYLARALTVDDDEQRREAAKSAIDEVPLWGPTQAIAQAIKQEL